MLQPGREAVQWCAADPQALMSVLFSNEGINSPDKAKQTAGKLSLSSVMADGASAVYPSLHAALTKAINHKEHDAVSPSEVKIFYTPAGWLLKYAGYDMYQQHVPAYSRNQRCNLSTSLPTAIVSFLRVTNPECQNSPRHIVFLSVQLCANLSIYESNGNPT